MAGGALPPRAVDLVRQRAPVPVGLGELHDGAVRLARVEERLLPIGVGQVDVDGAVAGAADTFERCGEVVDLEGEVVRTRAVPGDEALEEVVPFDVPGLEQLDVHASRGIAPPELYGPEPDAVAAEQDGPAELAH